MGTQLSKAGDKTRGLNLPDDVVGKFTSVEIDMLRKSFKDLAQRSPGKTIDKETFLKFFPMPGLHGERLFKEFDHKQTGVIDFEEFLTGLAVCVRGSFEEKAKLIFNLYDIDNTAYVSKDELRTMLHQIPKQALHVLAASVDDEELRNKLLSSDPDSKAAIEVVDRLVDSAFNSFDLNKDQKLSPEQFKMFVQNTPEVLDFLESVFPLTAVNSPASPDEPLSPRFSVDKYSSSREGRVYSIASSPPAPLDPAPRRDSRTRKFVKAFKAGFQPEDKPANSNFGYDSEEEGVLEVPGGIGSSDSHALEMSGTLFKLGRRTKKQVRRLFLIRGQVLYYYHPNKLELPAGMVFLQGCFVRRLGATGGTGSSASATGASVGKITLRSEFSESTFRNNKGAKPADMNIRGSISGGVANLFGFEIITSQGGERDSRTYFTKTEAERNRWIAAIEKASNVIPFSHKYRRLERLGRGKFATVYKCEVRGMNDEKPEDERQYFAVKVIDKGMLNEKERELLRTEIAVLKLVHHPFICGMQDVYESLNHIYIVLEFVEGGELFDRIVGRARLTELEAYPIIKQLAEAVQYLHVLGIVHRDIKPENILVAGDKSLDLSEATLKICDFGLSKLVSPKGKLLLACGTLSYVGPEVLTGKGYNKESDLWSIGIILYLVRRGRLPFDGETKEDIIYDTVHSELDFESDPVFSKSSTEEVKMLEGLLCKDPSKRLSAKQLLEHDWMKLMAKEWAEKHQNQKTQLDEIPVTDGVALTVATAFNEHSSPSLADTDVDSPTVVEKRQQEVAQQALQVAALQVAAEEETTQHTDDGDTDTDQLVHADHEKPADDDGRVSATQRASAVSNVSSVNSASLG